MPWDSQVMTLSKRLTCLRQLFEPAPFDRPNRPKMNCREAGLQGSAVHSQRDKATNGPRFMTSIKGQGSEAIRSIW